MKGKKILGHAQIFGLAMLLEKDKALVLSDLHLGKETSFHKAGVLLPKFNYSDIRKRLEEIFKKIESRGKRIQTIAVNGDLKHEFGKASEQEWQEVLNTLELMKGHAKKIVLIKGNHDVSLGPIANWSSLSLLEELFLPKTKTLVLHGDMQKLPKNIEKAKTLIVGHDHPAIVLREGTKREKYKCFLKGKWNKKTVIALPAFTSMSEGIDVLESRMRSRYLQENTQEFEVWAIEGEKEYYFGKIKDLK